MSDTPRTEAFIAKLEAELGNGPAHISEAAIDVAVRLRLIDHARKLEQVEMGSAVLSGCAVRASAQNEQPAGNDEWQRLKEIEHLAWHILEAAAENASTGEVTIEPLREDYDKLVALLPEGHPDAT